MSRAGVRLGSRSAGGGGLRRPEPLTLDHLAALPTLCRECVFWELDPVRRARVRAGEAAGEKRAWASYVLREWGSCGRVVCDDDRPVGYVVYAPPAFVPGAEGFATAPVSPDAVLMGALWVDPAHRGGGLGRSLVRAMARDLVDRGGIRAVEAFGVRRISSRGRSDPPRPSEPCVVPADFLGRVGFGTQRAHPQHPRMRMDLRSALTWREGVEAALERLVGAVRPESAPAPGASRSRPHGDPAHPV